jgi:hypothetical protein
MEWIIRRLKITYARELTDVQGHAHRLLSYKVCDTNCKNCVVLCLCSDYDVNNLWTCLRCTVFVVIIVICVRYAKEAIIVRRKK